jgi:hypothetical protein
MTSKEKIKSKFYDEYKQIMKGKNFSCNNITGKRNKNDHYQTPLSVTKQLLENEKFDYSKTVLEPAAGRYAIVKVLNKNFNPSLINAYDIDAIYSKNFFDEKNSYDYIITNPPLKSAFQFIQKSKQIARLKFALLLPLSYLHGQKRYEEKIFLDPHYPLIKIYVFTRYIMFTDKIRNDGKYRTGMIAWAWYIWENSNQYPKNTEIPVIKWIDNQKYIINAKDKNET